MGSGSRRWVIKFSSFIKSCGEEGQKIEEDTAFQSSLGNLDSGLRTYLLLVRQSESNQLCDIFLLEFKNIPLFSVHANLRVCISTERHKPRVSATFQHQQVYLKHRSTTILKPWLCQRL